MINLIYIRAAIEQATGQRLTLARVRELLVEEGLITARQAAEKATIFSGYNDFFHYDASTKDERDKSLTEGLPDTLILTQKAYLTDLSRRSGKS